MALFDHHDTYPFGAGIGLFVGGICTLVGGETMPFIVMGAGVCLMFLAPFLEHYVPTIDPQPNE